MADPSYPYDALSRVTFADPTYCFALIPFHRDFEPVLKCIKEAAKSCGLTCDRADQLGDGRIMSNVLAGIARAAVIVADISDFNANVMYELGIAHSAKDSRRVVLITQTAPEKLAADLRAHSVVHYRAGDETALRQKLEARFRAISFYSDAARYAETLMESAIPAAESRRRLFDRTLPDCLDQSGQDAFAEVVRHVFEASDTLNPDVIRPLLERLSPAMCAACLRLGREDARPEEREDRKSVALVLVSLLGHFPAVDFAIESLMAMLGESWMRSHWGAEDDDLKDIRIEAGFCLLRSGIEEIRIQAFEALLPFLVTPKVSGVAVRKNRIENHLALLAHEAPLSLLEPLRRASIDREPHVRESVADIMGESRRDIFVAPLSAALQAEGAPQEERGSPNPYAARSQISALGRIAAQLCGPAILTGVEALLPRAVHEWGFVIANARVALDSVDQRQGMEFRSELEQMLDQYPASAEWDKL